MIHHLLLPAKLKFFEILSGKLNAFLRAFQTDSPIIPFLPDALGGVVCDFLSRIILKDVLTNIYQLVQLDPLNKDIRKPTDIGFAAKLNLEQCVYSRNRLVIF